MKRSIFYRLKGVTSWTRYTGSVPFYVVGLEPDFTYEVDDGTGIREVVAGAPVVEPEPEPEPEPAPEPEPTESSAWPLEADDNGYGIARSTTTTSFQNIDGRMSQTYSEPVEVGHYAGGYPRGSVWMLGTATSEISSYGPPFRTGEGISLVDDFSFEQPYDDAQLTDVRRMNGISIDPQVDARFQGWDSAITAADENRIRNNQRPYFQSFFYDDGERAKLPIKLRPGSVAVQVRSAPDLSSKQIQTNGGLEQSFFVTAVSERPLEGQFRPPLIKDPAAINRVWHRHDFDFDKLPSIANIEEPPSIEQLVKNIDRDRLDVRVTWNRPNVDQHKPASGYGRSLLSGMLDPLTFVVSDAPVAQKQAVAECILQLGIDNWGTVKAAIAAGHTNIWRANGGWNGGRIVPILLAGYLSNDEEMLNVINIMSDATPDSPAERGQWTYVTRRMIDEAAAAYEEEVINHANTHSDPDSTQKDLDKADAELDMKFRRQFPEGALGIPEYVGRHGINAKYNKFEFGYSGDGAAYRFVNVPHQSGQITLVAACNLQDYWNEMHLLGGRRLLEYQWTGRDPYADKLGIPSPTGWNNFAPPNTYADRFLSHHGDTLVPWEWDRNEWISRENRLYATPSPEYTSF